MKTSCELPPAGASETIGGSHLVHEGRAQALLGLLLPQPPAIEQLQRGGSELPKLGIVLRGQQGTERKQE